MTLRGASSSLQELPVEVWTRIITFLERIRPDLMTKSWSELHQQDLATMMRVSKLHFEVTAPILYREPIVENLWSFLQSSDLQIAGSSQSLRIDEGCGDRKDTSPMNTTKGFCYKHTQRLHLILRDTSYSFSYSTILLAHDSQQPFSYWNLVELIHNPRKGFWDDERNAYDLTSLMWAYESRLKGVAREAANTPSHRHLRLKGLTFGAYGDLAWNSTGPKYGPYTIKESLKGLSTPESDIHTWTKRMIGDISLSKQKYLGSYRPLTHCTRFYGGPLGSDGLPFSIWRDKEKYEVGMFKPRINFFHTFPGPPFPITLGSANVIILHPDDPGPVYLEELTNSLLMQLLAYEVCADDLIKNQLMEIEAIGGTTIHIYAVFDVKQNTEKHFKKAGSRLNRELFLFPGKISIFPYEKAPKCPSCGCTPRPV